MHGFEKGPPPEELVAFVRAKTIGEGKPLASVGFDQLDSDTKQALQETLAARQGYLCAYCGSRIRPDKMRIEHWEPQHAAPEKRFDWENLLGVCPGDGAGQGSHCDRRRGELPPEEQLLHVKPDRDRLRIETLFTYSSVKGGLRIEAESDADAQRDVDRTLALNHPVLMWNRAQAVKAVRERLYSRFGPRTVTRSFLDELAKPTVSGGCAMLEPFLPALRPQLAQWARKTTG